MVTADMDLALSAINASAVVGQKGWLAGYQTCFDLSKSAVTKSNFGLGYSTSDMVLHTSLTNGSDFGGSVFQKLSPKLETGVTLGWSSANTNTKVSHHSLDFHHFFKKSIYTFYFSFFIENARQEL